MVKHKLTYQELEKKLAEAEQLIAVLSGNEHNIAIKERNAARSERDTAANLRDAALLDTKDAEKAYLESEQNFRNSMDACPLGIRVITAEGELIYANQAILDIYGYDNLEALKAVSREQLYTPESLAAHIDRKEKRKLGKNVPPEYEISIRRPDGKVRTLRVFRKEIVWGGERQFMAMYEDATIRLQAEQALRESEEKFARAFYTSPNLMAITTIEEGRIIEINDAFCRTTGYTREESIGLTSRELNVWNIAAQRDTIIQKLQTEGQADNIEIEMRAKSGEIRQLIFSMAQITFNNTPHLLTVAVDITERKAAQSTLKNREEFLNNIIENTPSPLWVSDDKGTVIRMNQALRDLLKVTDEEIIGKYNVLKDTQVIEQGFLPLVKSVFEEGKTVSFTLDYQTVKEIQVNPAQPVHRMLEIVISAVKNEHGKVIHAVCQEKDITERIAAEEALRESEERFHALFNTMAQGVVYQDETGSIVAANPAAERILGLTLSQMQGRTSSDPRWKSLREDGSEFPGDQHPSIIALRTGQPVNNVTMAVFNPGINEHRWIIINAVPEFRQGEKTPYRVYTTFTDVTERLQAEKALKDGEKKIYSIFSAAPVGIGMVVNRIFTEVNQRFCDMLGYTRDELIGQSARMIYPGDEEYEYVGKEKYNQISVSGTGAVETCFMCKDGTILNVMLSSAALDPADLSRGVTFTAINITERKKAEAALKESEERFSKAFQASPDLMAITDFPEGRIIDANRAYCRRTGYDYEELIGHTAFQLNMWANPEQRDEYYKEINEAYCINDLEIELRTKSGEIRTLLLSAEKITLHNKLCMLTVALDITERKKAEEKYQTVVKTTLDGFSVIDLNGKLLEVNDSFCQMVGYTCQELLNMNVADIEVDDTLEIITSRIRQVVTEGYGRFETRHKHKDGHILDIEVSIKHHRSHEGQLFVFMHDITNRKQAEQSINHLNLTLRSIRNVNQLITREKDRDRLIQGICDNLVTSGSFGSAWIILLDDNRQPVTWAQANAGPGFPALEEAFKRGELPHCAQKALKQKRVTVMEDPHEQCRGCPVLNANVMIGSMTVKLESEGHIYGFLNASMPRSQLLVEDEKSLFSEVAVDIAFALRNIELGAANEQLVQESLRAAKLESIGTLAGGIAHDFNNLLTGIMGNIGLAKTYLSPSDAVFEMLDEAEKAAVRSRDLTQQLLTFARGGKPIKKVVNIAHVIQEAATFALRGSKVRLVLSVPDDLWLIEADEGQISQVIHNLVINADEAMPTAGILKIEAGNHIIKAADALPLASGNYVRIDVSDTGTGISPEHLQRIFEPYFTTKQKGSGLGLTSAYSIVRNHGGSLLAESVLNKGSVFHIYLPASRKTRKGEKKLAAAKSTQAGGKVLIMDDDATIRKMLKNMLNLAGYEVEDSMDGVEAIEKYKKAMDSRNPFSAVIMDLTIPGGMGGKEAIKQLLEIDPAAAVIVSSGYATDPIMSEFKKYGFSAVIAKPYSISQLQETLTGLSPKNK